MLSTLLRRGWPGLIALAWIAALPASRADAQGIPISTNAVFYYRFDVRVGPAAFARPAGPWYSYFPIDPNLLAQPQRSAFPNWPAQFPPQQTPVPTAPRPLSYYATPPATQAAYNPAYVGPVGNYGQAGYWYAR